MMQNIFASKILRTRQANDDGTVPHSILEGMDDSTGGKNGDNLRVVMTNLSPQSDESSSSSSNSSSRSSKPINRGSWLKYLSLTVLVLQNAALVLVTRYATTRDKKTPFLKTVAVFWNEVIKIVVAFVLFFLIAGSPRKAFREFRQKFSFVDTLKLAIPALAYTVQTFLLYTAIENLEAGTFMVTYQLKILTTAFFTVLILKRRLSVLQWLALLLLVAGVATVQISADQKDKQQKENQQQNGTFPATNATNGSSEILQLNQSNDQGNVTRTTFRLLQSAAVGNNSLNLDNISLNSTNSLMAFTNNQQNSSSQHQNLVKGVLSVLAVCFLSGFAGVYVEKILKRSADVSIWLQNVQLSLMAIPISLCVVAIQDGRKVLEAGFMQGFDMPVWGIVFLQSLGGLATAVVIKYADNILKAFAVAFGIILVSVASIFLFSVIPKPLFIIGAGLVIVAVAVYSLFPPNQRIGKSEPQEMTK